MDRNELAEKIATAIDGRVWAKGDHVRVYVRDGNREGYIAVVSDTTIEYHEGRLPVTRLYDGLAKAGLISTSDIETIIGG